VITHPDSLTTSVTGLTNGTYIFNIQTTDNNTATISARDTIVVSGTGGMARAGEIATRAGVGLNADGVRAITIYPNPVLRSQQLAVGVRNWHEGRARFAIHDASGRLMQQVVVEQPASDFVQRISISGLAKGAYLLTVSPESGGKPEVIKFIVQ
jgi:hypothetical protein